MADHHSPFLVPDVDLGVARLVDQSHLAKWRFWEDIYDVALGTARRRDSGLVICVSPGEWVAIGDRPNTSEVVDLTHVRAALRMSGPGSRSLLGHVCALDLGDSMTPDGAAARTLVAGVASELVREDEEGEPSYLLLFSRSFARSVGDALTEAARLS